MTNRKNAPEPDAPEPDEKVDTRKAAIDDRARKRAEYEAALAELAAEDAADGLDDKPPTHALLLANGDVVQVLNGGPVTHHDVGTKDKPNPVRVLQCVEL